MNGSLTLHLALAIGSVAVAWATAPHPAEASFLAVEAIWVLWVEAPAGSDQWSIARVPQSRFTSKDACERNARSLNDIEDSMAKAQRLGGGAGDHYSCLPDSVDPRP